MSLAALPGQLIGADAADGVDFMCDWCVCRGRFVSLHFSGCGDINGFTP